MSSKGQTLHMLITLLITISIHYHSFIANDLWKPLELFIERDKYNQEKGNGEMFTCEYSFEKTF